MEIQEMPDSRNTIKEFINTLEAQATALRRGNIKSTVHASTVELLEEVIERITQSFPNKWDLLFEKSKYFVNESEGSSYYNRESILTWYSTAIQRLKSLEEIDVQSNVIEHSFDFISDTELKRILKRDYTEIQKCISTHCYKATIVLGGSIVEALLLDRLIREPLALTAKNNSKRHPKNLDKWDLFELIAVALELNIISENVSKSGDTLRSYRNLIHPGLEKNSSISFGKHQADIVKSMVSLVIDELSR